VNPTSHSTDYLLRIAESAHIPVARPTNELREFAAKDGWTVVISNKIGGPGRIDHLVSPDGEFVSPWDWPEYPDGEPNPDRQRMIDWRPVIGWPTGVSGDKNGH
jgi:hypothetical protein